MKYYATIKLPAVTQKMYVEGKSFFICTSDHMIELYGDPEKYIKAILHEAQQTHTKVVIEK